MGNAMRLLVVGGTGTIGVEVVKLLETRHDVVVASRTSAVRVDIRDSASIDQLISTVGPIDGVVSCAGRTKFGMLDELSTEDIAESLANKLIGQIALARASVPAIRDRGVIVLSSGLLSVNPTKGSTAKSVANAGVEAFVRAVALELPRGIRAVAVSPGWVGDPPADPIQDPRPFTSARQVALAYLEAIEGSMTGVTIPIGAVHPSA